MHPNMKKTNSLKKKSAFVIPSLICHIINANAVGNTEINVCDVVQL